MITPEEFEPKLTPQAGAVLDELLRDTRDAVLAAAAASSIRAKGEPTEISVRDILAAYGDIAAPVASRQARRTTWRLLFSTYAVFGAMLLVLATSYIVATRFSSDPFENVSVLFAIVGALFAILGTLGGSYYNLRRWRAESEVLPRAWRADPDMLASDFVRRWAALEFVVRRSATMALGSSMADAPMSVLLDGLRRAGVLSVADVETLRRVVEVRNAVVHRQRQLDRGTYADLVRRIEAMSERLEVSLPDHGRI